MVASSKHWAVGHTRDLLLDWLHLPYQGQVPRCPPSVEASNKAIWPMAEGIHAVLQWAVKSIDAGSLSHHIQPGYCSCILTRLEASDVIVNHVAQSKQLACYDVSCWFYWQQHLVCICLGTINSMQMMGISSTGLRNAAVLYQWNWVPWTRLLGIRLKLESAFCN